MIQSTHALFAGATRVPLPATISGPGGGKSFFIDEWLLVRPADLDALELALNADYPVLYQVYVAFFS